MTMIIQYERIVEDYLQNLTTQLRKFAPSEEFLDLWVHDEDHAASILNMIEAAHSHDLESISIQVSSQDTLKSLDINRLIKAAEGMCGITVGERKGNGLLLSVDFKRKPVQLVSLEMTDVPMLYRPRFNNNKESRGFGRALSKKTSFILAEISGNGVSLQANIAPKNNFVCELGYAGPTTSISKRLLDELCTHMLQKPIIECRDHAVISLEYSLRDKSQKRTPPGIITPFNSWLVFRGLTNLTRGLMADYQKKTGYQKEANFYSPPISPEWLSLSDPEKRNVLAQAIEGFCKGRNVEPHWFAIKEIQHQFKVIMDMHPETCGYGSTVLLELEVYLREHVEQTLCIHKEEEPDQNKMRWDKPVVKSQTAISKVVNLRR